MISTNICHVIVENDTLRSTFPPPLRGAYNLLAFFFFAELLCVLYGLVGLSRGWQDAALCLIFGPLMPAIPMWGLWEIHAREGTFLIDNDGIRRTRDDVEIGSWSASEVVLSIRRSRSTQSHPYRLGREDWLTATTSSGTTLYLAHGLADELASVRSWIEACWGSTVEP